MGQQRAIFLQLSFLNVPELEQLAKCLHCCDKLISADNLWNLNSVIGTVNTLRAGMSLAQWCDFPQGLRNLAPLLCI
jgi:hypothetical protein